MSLLTVFYISIKILYMLNLIRGHTLNSCLALQLIYLKFLDINKNTQIYTRGISLKTFRSTVFFLISNCALSKDRSQLTGLVGVAYVCFSP